MVTILCDMDKLNIFFDVVTPNDPRLTFDPINLDRLMIMICNVDELKHLLRCFKGLKLMHMYKSYGSTIKHRQAIMAIVFIFLSPLDSSDPK